MTPMQTRTGHVVDVRAPQRADVARIYQARFPDLAAEADPMVIIDLDPNSIESPV